MECEFSVELGPDDPTLAVPWQSPDGEIHYIDLRGNPNAIDQLSEVRNFPELGDFLRALNAGEFATAKCDAWFDTQMDVDDEPYEAEIKCCSYVDVFFAGERRLASFAEHEDRAREVVKRVRAAEDAPMRAELVLRRAYFEAEQGFYWTLYATGYGSDTDSAREQWAKCLKILQYSLQQTI